MTALQKLSLVAGVVWLVFYTGALAAEIGNPGSFKGGGVFVGMFLPVLLLWWPTGVLKIVISWFKGEKV